MDWRNPALMFIGFFVAVEEAPRAWALARRGWGWLCRRPKPPPLWECESVREEMALMQLAGMSCADVLREYARRADADGSEASVRYAAELRKTAEEAERAEKALDEGSASS